MALLRNGRTTFQNPGRFNGIQSFQTGNYIKGGLRNRFAGGLDAVFGGYNNGALSPKAFILPQKSGSISSYTKSKSTISTNSNLTPAMPMNASASNSLTVLNAQLDQVIQFIANGVMNLTGSSTLAAAVQAQITGVLQLAASGTLGGIFPTYAQGTFTLNENAVLTARAYIQANAGGPTPLSPEGLANAVLDALLADHNLAGSVGEALNNIGASSNPWDADLASNNSPGSFGERVQKLLTTTKFLGLK